MNPPRRRIAILMADDDADDRAMTLEAFRESRVVNPLLFVNDGEELMGYLRREGQYADETRFPMPGLILLDLNMPRKDGREALAEIRADPALRHLPIVMLTTSKADDDVMATYQHGANSFITKPVTFPGLIEVVSTLKRYWLEVVDLPDEGAAD